MAISAVDAGCASIDIDGYVPGPDVDVFATFSADSAPAVTSVTFRAWGLVTNPNLLIVTDTVSNFAISGSNRTASTTLRGVPTGNHTFDAAGTNGDIFTNTITLNNIKVV